MSSLTVSFVEQVIDESINGKDEKWQKNVNEQGWYLRRSSTPADWADLVKKAANTTSSVEEELSHQVPYFFGIGIYSLGQHDTPQLCCGFITFYLAYSTWDARCVFIDRLDLPHPGDMNVEKTILRSLADIAVRLQCGRLCWEVGLLGNHP